MLLLEKLNIGISMKKLLLLLPILLFAGCGIKDEFVNKCWSQDLGAFKDGSCDYPERMEEEPTVTIPYKYTIEDCLRNNVNACAPSVNLFDGENKKVSLREALQLIIDSNNYKYVPEERTSKPAHLVK